MDNMIERIFDKLGYKKKLNSEELMNAYNLTFLQEAIVDFNKVKGYSMLSFLKMATLFEKAAFIETSEVEGAFVECGVWKGGSVGMMALANLRFGIKRRDLYLFDAFDNICEPIPEIDGEQALLDVKQLIGRLPKDLSGKLKPIRGVYDARGGHGTVEECELLLSGALKYDEDHIFIHKGWFQDTLPKASSNIESIAILRLDADWYESTKVCLEHLFDKVVKGGFVIIDDYGRYDGCKKAVDEFLESRELKLFLNYSDHLNGECRYLIKS